MSNEANLWNRNNSAWRQVVDSDSIELDVSEKEKASFKVKGPLAAIASLEPTEGAIVVGDGEEWVTESGDTARTSLGVGATDSPQFAGVNLGDDDDTTLSRAGPGVVAVEGSPLAFRRPGINAQTGASYTLALSDEGNIVTMSNGSANTLTIPASASVAFPIPSIINIVQIGAGVTTIEGDTGVTVNGASGGASEIGDRYQGATLLKIASDTWIASGNVDEFA
jgi:hypothetical protein